MKKIYWLILSLSVLACQKLPEGPQDIPDTPYVPRTELGKMVAKAPSVAHIYADSTFLLATGVDETDIHFQTSDYKVEHAFLLRIKLNTPGVKMKLVLPDDKDTYVVGARQTPSDMISLVDKPGRRVVAAVNADFWDTSNGKTRGPIHKDGTVLKDDFFYSSTLTDQAISFIGFDYDGLPVIRDSAYYRPHQSEFRDLTGSGVLVVRGLGEERRELAAERGVADDERGVAGTARTTGRRPAAATGEDAHGGAFDIAFNAGKLSSDINVRSFLEG